MKQMHLIIGITALISVAMLFSCQQKTKTTTDMKFNWTKLSTNGLQGDLAKGVSASYTALIDGKLIVAGGANFPGKLGFEGGSKAFYNEIMLFDASKDEWRHVGALPDKMAYGVSVPVSGGALWIGGNTESQSLNSVYKVTLANDSIGLNPFPTLPATMDNFAGCALDNTVFVGGGSVNGKPSNAFYSIHAGDDTAWTVLPEFPGSPRVQPVMTAIEQNGKQFVYVLGGFFGGNAGNKPTMATDVLRYDVAAQTWEKVGEQLDTETKKPFSLGGAAATAIDNRYILCFGGVNYEIFLDAITTQYNIGNDNTTSAEEKARLNLEFSKTYMTQPIEYYKFNPECRIFDTVTGEWKIIDVTPNAARAGATLVSDGKTIYAVQGELKPGLRSADTWTIELY